MKKYLIFISMGFELISGIIACYFVAPYLDRYFSSKGTAMAILVITVMVAWFIRIIYLAQKISKEKK